MFAAPAVMYLGFLPHLSLPSLPFGQAVTSLQNQQLIRTRHIHETTHT